MRDPALWERIRDEPIVLKLKTQSPETHLVKTFRIGRYRAGQLVMEYRRFLYLVAVAGEVLAPSRSVDEVWHAHLAAPNDSWSRFCTATIGWQPFHFTGRPAPEDDPAYLRTLTLLDEEFGPRSIRPFWPVPGFRHPWHRLPLILWIGGLLIAALVGLVHGPFVGGVTAFIAIAIGELVRYNLNPDQMMRRDGDGCGGGDGSGCGGGGD